MKLMFFIFFITTCLFGKTFECGIYEIEGQYSYLNKTITVYPKSLAEFKITLTGDKVLYLKKTIDNSFVFMKIEIKNNIVNTDFEAELIEYISPVNKITSTEDKIKLIKKASCSKKQ